MDEDEVAGCGEEVDGEVDDGEGDEVAVGSGKGGGGRDGEDVGWGGRGGVAPEVGVEGDKFFEGVDAEVDEEKFAESFGKGGAGWCGRFGRGMREGRW